MSLVREAERCLANQKSFASLNALITPLNQAGPWRQRVSDAEARRSSAPRSPLDGRLVAVKDNICTRDLPTTCSSKILESFSSPFNASVIEYLQKAGVIIAGKTNMDEFGMGSHSIHSHFGHVSSQMSGGGDTLSAGGSSGGSAVATATGQCYAALGTDTGGSVRLPAAYTGTVGFKPSYGLISRWGVIAYANSLDTVGILGPRVSVVREVFDIVNQHDERDPTSISDHTRSCITTQILQKSRSQLRVGVPLEYNIHELTPTVRNAWKRSLKYLQRQGHTIHAVSLPATKQALSAYYVLAPGEASSNLAKYDGIRYGTRDPNVPDNSGGYLYAHSRGTGFGDEVKRRILLGGFTLSAAAIDNYFIQAQRVRRLVQKDFNSIFSLQNPLLSRSTVADEIATDVGRGVDVLLCPTAPSLPPSIGSLRSMKSVEAYVNDVFTVPASLAGLPALSVPVPLEDGDIDGVSSVGMQVIGQFGDDELVLSAGEILEGMSS